MNSLKKKKRNYFQRNNRCEVVHTTKFDEDFVPDATSIVAHFTRSIMKELRLYGSCGYIMKKLKSSSFVIFLIK